LQVQAENWIAPAPRFGARVIGQSKESIRNESGAEPSPFQKPPDDVAIKFVFIGVNHQNATLIAPALPSSILGVQAIL
jgi:hypothetical protein